MRDRMDPDSGTVTPPASKARSSSRKPKTGKATRRTASPDARTTRAEEGERSAKKPARTVRRRPNTSDADEGAPRTRFQAMESRIGSVDWTRVASEPAHASVAESPASDPAPASEETRTSSELRLSDRASVPESPASDPAPAFEET